MSAEREVREEARSVICAVPEQAHGPVAVHAEQTSPAFLAGRVSRTASVIVINGQLRTPRVGLQTDRADAILSSQQRVVSLSRQPVMLHEPPGEFSLAHIGIAVSYPVVARVTQPACINRSATATTVDPRRFRPGATPRPECHTRAKQSVSHSSIRGPVLLGKHEKSRALGVKPRDNHVLLRSKSTRSRMRRAYRCESHNSNHTRIFNYVMRGVGHN